MSKRNRGQVRQKKQQAAAAFNEVPPGEEIYHMPTQPDPNTKITVPQSMAGKIDYSKFIIIWHSNINAKKTVAKGRRVPLTHACDDPIVAEMSEVCSFFNLVHIVEPFKLYPRDWTYPGRLRVQLTDEDGNPCNAEVPTRRVLMMKMGELIPKLKIRNQRLESEKRKEEAAKAVAATQVASGGKKKGKKGRK